MAKSWGDTKGNDRVRWEETVEIFDIKKQPKQIFRIRLLGSPFCFGRHWVEFTNNQNQSSAFPVDCPDFNSETECSNRSGLCDCCTLDYGIQKNYLTNVIDRSAQENFNNPMRNIINYPAEQADPYRKKSHQHWSPVKVMEMKVSACNLLRQIYQINVHPDPITGAPTCWDPADPDFGVDLAIKYDPDQPPAQQYFIQMVGRTPLTAEERAYKLWDVEHLVVPTPAEEIHTSLVRLGYMVDPNVSATQAANSATLDMDNAMPAPPAAPLMAPGQPMGTAQFAQGMDQYAQTTMQVPPMQHMAQPLQQPTQMAPIQQQTMPPQQTYVQPMQVPPMQQPMQQAAPIVFVEPAAPAPMQQQPTMQTVQQPMQVPPMQQPMAQPLQQPLQQPVQQPVAPIPQPMPDMVQQPPQQAAAPVAQTSNAMASLTPEQQAIATACGFFQRFKGSIECLSCQIRGQCGSSSL